jgi:hypothetical protein
MELGSKRMELLDGGAVKWTGKFEWRWSQIDLNILDGAEVKWVRILGLNSSGKGWRIWLEL